MNHPADSSHLHTRKGQASWTGSNKERKKEESERSTPLHLSASAVCSSPGNTAGSPRSFVLAREDNLKALAGFDLLIFSLGLWFMLGFFFYAVLSYILFWHHVVCVCSLWRIRLYLQYLAPTCLRDELGSASAPCDWWAAAQRREDLSKHAGYISSTVPAETSHTHTRTHCKEMSQGGRVQMEIKVLLSTTEQYGMQVVILGCLTGTFRCR